MSSSSSSPGARAFRRRNEARLELVMNTALAVVRRYNREARNARAARRRLLAHCERFSIEEEELRVHKAKEAGLHNDLSVHMWEWRLRNPDAWLQWATHVSISGNCTDSKTRRFQIALWYTLRVPENVIKALQNLVLHYYNELIIDHELLTLQVDFGDVPVPEESFADDDTWARLMPFDIPFGSDYEGEALENGFSDHIPKGEGIDMLKHMMANFEARKIRIAHCHIDQFNPLMGMFHEWYQTAYDIVTNLPDTPRNLKAAREEAIERLDNYFRRAPGFQRDDLGLDHPVDEDARAHLLSIGLT